MTRVFDAAGTHVPVTVIEAGPCPRHLRCRRAAELGFGAKKATRTPKASPAMVKKAGVEIAPRIIRRFAVTGEAPAAGSAVTVAIFAEGDRVKVSGSVEGPRLPGRRPPPSLPTVAPRPRQTRATASRDRSRRARTRRASSKASACLGIWARGNFTEIGLRCEDRRRAQSPVRARSVPGPMNGLVNVRKQGGRAAMIEAPTTPGRPSKKAVSLPEALFDGTVNEDVLHRAVITFLSNSGRATSDTKTRSEVSGGNQKPWRQKGTGRPSGFDAGSALAHGGIAHGPHPRSYRLGIPKKMRQLARSRRSTRARAKARSSSWTRWSTRSRKRRTWLRC